MYNNEAKSDIENESRTNLLNTKNQNIKMIIKSTKNKFLTHHFFTLALLEYVCNLLNSRDRQAAEHQFEGKLNKNILQKKNFIFTKIKKKPLIHRGPKKK